MLQIRKKAEDVFKHYNEQGTFLLSRGYFKIDNGVFFIVEAGGARRNTYAISEITVYDDTDSGTPETFTTDIALYERLVELRYNLVETSSGGFVSDLTSSPQDYPFVDTNTFVLPNNYVIVSVHINGSLYKKAEYNKSGNNLLIIDFLEVGDIVEVRGVVAIGSFGTGGVGGGSQSFEDVLQVNRTATTSPLIPNATEPTGAVNLQQLETKQTKPIIISANKTAVVNEVYNNTANVTYTDPTSPTPVNGNIYTVNVLSGTATIGGIGYTSGKVIRYFNGTVWLTENLNKNPLHAVLIDNNIGDVVQHTGTTITTIVKSYVIPAGFFTSDCVFETDLTISKIGTAGNIIVDFGIKPSTVTFPIHLTSATAGNRYINIGRKMTMIKNGLILGFGVSGFGYSDKLANAGAIDKASLFDPTISNTFNLSITLGNVSDIALLENLTIKVYKNA